MLVCLAARHRRYDDGQGALANSRYGGGYAYAAVFNDPPDGISRFYRLPFQYWMGDLTETNADDPFYVSDENGEKTYAAIVEPDGTLSDLKLFTDRGGESVAVDDKGNVYIAAGQISVYDPSGHLIDTIDVPERPSQLLFGGRDGHTLFVLARSSLYAVQTTNRGR